MALEFPRSVPNVIKVRGLVYDGEVVGFRFQLIYGDGYRLFCDVELESFDYAEITVLKKVMINKDYLLVTRRGELVTSQELRNDHRVENITESYEKLSHLKTHLKRMILDGVSA